MPQEITLSEVQVGNRPGGGTYMFRNINYPVRYRTTITLGTVAEPVFLNADKYGFFKPALENHPELDSMIATLESTLSALGIDVYRTYKVLLMASNAYCVETRSYEQPPTGTPLTNVVFRLPPYVVVYPPNVESQRSRIKLFVDSYSLPAAALPPTAMGGSIGTSERQAILASLQSLQAFVAGSAPAPSMRMTQQPHPQRATWEYTIPAPAEDILH
jgi:hypothetical protein